MAVNVLDKVGSVGAVVAAMAMPCCFPFLGVFGSIIGLSIFVRYEESILYAIQGLVLLALVGSFIAYRRHRKLGPLILSIVSVASIIYGINSYLDTYYIYPGLAGLLIVSVWNSLESKRCEK